jgi:hypothetical protein
MSPVEGVAQVDEEVQADAWEDHERPEAGVGAYVHGALPLVETRRDSG